MIKNLIFDFGQVLITYDYPSFLRSVFGDGSDFAAFEELVCGEPFIRRCDLGSEPFSDIVREAQRDYPHWRDQLQVYHDRQLDAIDSEMPGMHELLIRLKDKGYCLYGLSNWSDTIYPVMDKFGIFGLLDDRVISCEEQLIKPDRAIYNRLCDKFALAAEDCLFTDDRPANIIGAQDAGMQAVLFTTTEQYEADLRRLGVL